MCNRFIHCDVGADGVSAPEREFTLCTLILDLIEEIRPLTLPVLYSEH
jgi:hypothetical protein